MKLTALAVVILALGIVAGFSPISSAQEGGGPRRTIQLTVVGAGVELFGAGGSVQVFPTSSDSHTHSHFGTLHPHQHPKVTFEVHGLICRNQVGDSPQQMGLSAYRLYLTTETHARTRIQTFNTSCESNRHSSSTILLTFDEETLTTENLLFEVVNEPFGLPAFVALRGEDIID